MPSRMIRIRDAEGNFIGVACSRARFVYCATAGCRAEGILLCDYPVIRRGRASTCSRRVCRKCAVTVGKDLDYCPPHARTHAEAEPARRVLEEFFPPKKVEP